MENEKNISIDKIIINPKLFEFELIKDIVYTRSNPLTRSETEQLLKIVKDIYLKKLEEYDDDIKSMFLANDYWGFIVDLTNWKRWGFIPVEVNTLNEIDSSLNNFFSYASKLISQLIDNKLKNHGDFKLNFPKSPIDKLNPNQIAILFLTMKKRKLIHPSVAKKDLAVILSALTGYKTGHFTGRFSKVYDEIEYDDTIIENLITELKLLISELNSQSQK